MCFQAVSGIFRPVTLQIYPLMPGFAHAWPVLRRFSTRSSCPRTSGASDGACQNGSEIWVFLAVCRLQFFGVQVGDCQISFAYYYNL